MTGNLKNASTTDAKFARIFKRTTLSPKPIFPHNSRFTPDYDVIHLEISAAEPTPAGALPLVWLFCLAAARVASGLSGQVVEVIDRTVQTVAQVTLTLKYTTSWTIASTVVSHGEYLSLAVFEPLYSTSRLKIYPIGQ